ncbi:hypothetical protein NDU88_002906 [Pleurodeles waltl]|uniref:Uncharacterized protein n=1 Tax=Pleurodeles waltl TaxID=8319 RepID=A0AAV7W0M8_PLEWA|nr:hypothetical protein NDU88_002906 [Pleurodeles waltl]
MLLGLLRRSCSHTAGDQCLTVAVCRVAQRSSSTNGTGVCRGSPHLPRAVRAPGILPGAIGAWFCGVAVATQERHGPNCRRVQASQSPARRILSVEAEDGCRCCRALPGVTSGLEPPAAGTRLETASDGGFRGQAETESTVPGPGSG